MSRSERRVRNDVQEAALGKPVLGRDLGLALKKRKRPKKGRPTAARLLEINRVILDAAARCFLDNGYSDASIDAVVAAARVSKVTLYSRYPNKETLFRAVVEDRLSAWSAESSKQDWMAGDTLEQRLRYYVTVVATWATKPEVRAFDRLLSTAPLRISQELHKRRYDSAFSFLAAEIETLTRAEGKPARNPSRVAFDLIALLAGWFRIETTMREITVEDAVAYGQHAVDILMGARAEW